MRITRAGPTLARVFNWLATTLFVRRSTVAIGPVHACSDLQRKRSCFRPTLRAPTRTQRFRHAVCFWQTNRVCASCACARVHSENVARQSASGMPCDKRQSVREGKSTRTKTKQQSTEKSNKLTLAVLRKETQEARSASSLALLASS